MNPCGSNLYCLRVNCICQIALLSLFCFKTSSWVLYFLNSFISEIICLLFPYLVTPWLGLIFLGTLLSEVCSHCSTVSGHWSWNGGALKPTWLLPLMWLTCLYLPECLQDFFPLTLNSLTKKDLNFDHSLSNFLNLRCALLICEYSSSFQEILPRLCLWIHFCFSLYSKDVMSPCWMIFSLYIFFHLCFSHTVFSLCSFDDYPQPLLCDVFNPTFLSFAIYNLLNP